MVLKIFPERNETSTMGTLDGRHNRKVRTDI